ncbi:MAG: NTP transferase domain-containing protein [Rhodobacterales bacterium]|nr:NTP transferase domain-containing protein [Rhodobacterales bacterium]
MHDAFILAAGFGTRLRPLTQRVPKPLVPVCGVPLLSWSLALCAQHGLNRVVVNGHWLADELAPWAGEHEGVHVTLSIETPDILGTGGGLKKVAHLLADKFVVLNGDVLHRIDLTALLGAIPDGGGAMALRRDPENAPKYGIVAADETGTVVQLTSLAVATAEGSVARDTHFTGIHALDRQALDRVPDGFACIVRTAYVQLVAERSVGATLATGPWLDCGDPVAYLETNLAVLRGEVRGAINPFERAAYGRTAAGVEFGDPQLVRDVDVKGAVWIGTGAQIAPGVVLHDTVIGAGAIVGPSARLTECVVWDNATLDQVCSQVIALDGDTRVAL